LHVVSLQSHLTNYQIGHQSPAEIGIDVYMMELRKEWNQEKGVSFVWWNEIDHVWRNAMPSILLIFIP